MKKKIYSLLLGICLIFGGLFSFSGCSIYTKDTSKANGAIVMRIGETDVTKNDLYSAFYTYYQNNSTYFAYYSQETIEESFYTWFTVKTLVSELSKKALYDADTNPNGYIYYTKEDADEVWKYVEDYFYSQISSYEKSIYQASGLDEEDYPEWLQDEDEEEEESKFEFYTSSTKEVEDELKEDRKSNATTKLSDKDVYEKVDELIANLFKYTVGDDETKKDMGEKGDEVYNRRNQAYTRYIEALKLSAKASGDKSSAKDLFKAEVLRIYKAYYESQVSVIFQNYYMEDYLFNKNDAGDKTSLSDRAIVAKFLDKYYQDKQVYSYYAPYVAVMEPEESTGSTLLMYHYEGETYYFSVQHILVSFSDDIKAQISSNNNGSSTDEFELDEYIQHRKNIADSNKNAILVEIDENREKNTLTALCNYYYYDEGLADVVNGSYKFDGDESSIAVYNGYVQLTTFNKTSAKYTWQSYKNSKGEVISNEESGLVDEVVGVKKMANLDDVETAILYNYKVWLGYAKQVYNATDMDAKIDEICKANDGKLEDLRYVLEVAKNYKANGMSEVELANKIASLVFIELEWIYSGDTLGNEISNKIGYMCSSFDDNDMSWVTEFADCARSVLKKHENDDFNDLQLMIYEFSDDEKKAIYTETCITDYGFHIIKVENVYSSKNASIVDLKNVSATYSLAENSDYVKEVAGLLKKTYVCSASNETLYDYFRDEVYSSLAGTSSSSGTYFLGLEYEWLAKYYNDGAIKTYEKIGYDELVDSLS